MERNRVAEAIETVVFITSITAFCAYAMYSAMVDYAIRSAL